MLRTATRPRWLALLLVVLIAASAMAWLGTWQLGRARERSVDAVADRQQAPPRDLLDVLGARQTFTADMVDVPVAAQGHWDGGRQLLVAGRELAGEDGFWVLTPLVLPDSSAVGVVRGWVPSPAHPAAAAPPAASPGTEGVVVHGVLRPGEAPADRAPGEGTGLPAGQVPAVAPADLVQRWPHPLLTGYVIATAVDPPAVPAPSPVPTVDAAEAGWNLRNVSYAVQWWIFAGFGLFMWWRLVRDDARGDLSAPARSREPAGVGPGSRGAAAVGDDGSSAAVPGVRP